MTNPNPFALNTPPQAPTPAQPAAQPPAPVTAPATNPFGGQQVATPAAPAVPAQPAAGDDPFDQPAPQRPRAPRLRDLYGRLVILIPHKLEEGVRSQFNDSDGNPQFQDRLTMDVIVLDGGTIHYGGKPEKTPPVPHNTTAEVPIKFEKVYDSHPGINSQCREALAKKVTQGRPGMVLGRVSAGDAKGSNNAPFILQPYTDQDKALANQYLATVDPFA